MGGRRRLADRLSFRTNVDYTRAVGAENVTFTIGYSGKSMADFMTALRDAGVNLVVDIRALPLSRKRGFSKTSLGESLSEAGIEYAHLRQAGNPYRSKKQDIERCLALYSAYIDERPDVVAAVEAAITGRRAALLCFEADACECHRSVIGERLKARDPRRRVWHI
jgi:uncharacterized protein (DUF488 family)